MPDGGQTSAMQSKWSHIMATAYSDRDWANRSTVVGLFDHQTQAESAINALKAAGFSERDIGVAMRDQTSQGELAEGTGTQAAEGAATGAVGGGVLGGVVGLLGGLGALAIPGLGPIFAAGWLGSTLAGAGIGAAAGGIIGGLVGLGVPENEARHFEQGLKEGRVLVTVKAEGRAAEAAEILRRHDGDLGPAVGAEARTAGAGTGARTAGVGDAGQERLELREEELDVDKQRVKAGEVRLRKEVRTEQRQVDVPVTREEVVVERRPVTGDAARAATGGPIADGEEIRVPIMEEEVRVEKRPVVKEEVTLRKRQVTGTERVNETLRREEARVDTEGEANVQFRGEPGRTGRTGGAERRRRRDPAYAGPERRLEAR
jgi:uncharacterized protein (TIGR02271 family)